MAIIASDLVWRPAKQVSDTTPAQNGGACDFTKNLTTNVKNNLLPDVSQTERLAGSTKYRKTFLHVNTNDNNSLLNGKAFIDSYTPGGDICFIAGGTTTDTEADASAYSFVGVGKLKEAYVANATTMVIEVENLDETVAENAFRAGVGAFIGDGLTTNYVTITQAVQDTVAGSITLTLAAGAVNAYAVGTTVSGLVTLNNFVGNPTVLAQLTSAAGGTAVSEFRTAYASPNNRGGIDEVWTLTFTSATDFTIAGDVVGAVGTGSTQATSAVTNPVANAPYFTITPEAFFGTFQTGETVRFATKAAAIALWVKRVVPANTPALANDYLSVSIIGESA